MIFGCIWLQSTDEYLCVDQRDADPVVVEQQATLASVVVQLLQTQHTGLTWMSRREDAGTVRSPTSIRSLRAMSSFTRPSSLALDARLENQVRGIQYLLKSDSRDSNFFSSAAVMNPFQVKIIITRRSDRGTETWSTVGLTSLHNVLQRGEPLADSGADGAQDEDWRQVCVPHEGSSQQATPLVRPVHVSGHHHHQVVGQREAGVLTPPAVEGQGHIETWDKNKEMKTMVFQILLFFETKPRQSDSPSTNVTGIKLLLVNWSQ